MSTEPSSSKLDAFTVLSVLFALVGPAATIASIVMMLQVKNRTSRVMKDAYNASIASIVMGIIAMLSAMTPASWMDEVNKRRMVFILTMGFVITLMVVIFSLFQVKPNDVEDPDDRKHLDGAKKAAIVAFVFTMITAMFYMTTLNLNACKVDTFKDLGSKIKGYYGLNK